MSNTLTQRSLRSRTTYTLEHDGVRVVVLGFPRYARRRVRYEDIPPKPFSGKIFRSPAAAVAFVVVLLGAAAVAVALWSDPGLWAGGVVALAVALEVALWFSRTEVKGFGTPGNGLLVTASRPSRAEVDAFLEQLKAARARYLREVYLERAPQEPPEDALRRLIWLKELEAITPAELEERRARLLPAQPAGEGMGFGRRP